MRKLRLFLLAIIALFYFINDVPAQEEGGQVILDLHGDYGHEREYDDRKFWPTIIQMGLEYVDDVKQYNEQLVGESIERDFTEDLSNKYPRYTPEIIEGWQKYVRKGVKALRFFEDIKQKVKKWVIDFELPIVVSDDQYELGEKEEYIESATPLIRENFKKVIAYSKSSKDRLAMEEKYAKDHNLTRPSKLIKWYRENIIQGNWKKILYSLWQDPFASANNKDAQNASAKLEKMVTTLIMRKNGFDESGKFDGVVYIKVPNDKVVLLNDYQNYAGLSLDFDRSENVEYVKAHFVLPNDIQDGAGKQLLFYGGKFSVYIEGKIKDVKQKAIIRLALKANVCADSKCELNYGNPELEIKPINNPQDGNYAYHINLIKRNVASTAKRDKFDLYGLFDDTRENKYKGIRLEFAADDNTRAKVFMIGEEAKHFAAPKISLNNKKINAWFELKDDDFDYKNHNYTFWLSQGSSNQYITTQKLRTGIFYNSGGTSFSFYVFCLAILGGLLLNFMPCVFPVLSLKLLAFTKFGGLNEAKIRSNFIYNSLGIGTAFLILAILLSCLKMAGVAMGWGMQFQSITFLAVMIWIVTYFLAYIFGIVGQHEHNWHNRVLQKFSQRDKVFEFLSGLFMVALSTPCMAPYLGTAMGIALAGSPIDIILAVLAVGLGLASPYILIAAFPRIAFYLPRPGKWLKWINTAMILMLIITLMWLVSLLAAQSQNGQIWHWILYIITALILWMFYDMLLKETDKVKDEYIRNYLYKKYSMWKIGLTMLLIIASLVDVEWAAHKLRKATNQTPVMPLNLQTIAYHIDQGNKVLVKIGADWCLTCKYNENFVLDLEYIRDVLENNKVLVMEVDWTNYNEQVLHFMQKFGRQGLPFYILFSPRFRDGIVLPEILDATELEKLINM